jgi:3',5'-cyclic-AMP phosphodiesterase
MRMDKKRLDRRDFLKALGITALGAAGACTSAPNILTSTASAASSVSTATSGPAQRPQAQPGKKRVLRIAHMTDFHMQPEGVALTQVAHAFRQVQTQADPPDIIVNTGDCVMDSLETDKPRVEAQWEAFRSVLDSECKLPIVHALGNHDVWGWGIADKSLEKDPLYGKGMALEKLGLQNRYYSFDRAGWHFIVLDSTHLRNKVSNYPYIGQLDDEQRAWFLSDVRSLAAQESPVCILSHIPILAACEYFDGPNEESGNWVIPGSWVHIDARQFRDLFVQSPRVRLCLSGHTHQFESLDYLGVRYITSGAICGNWWKGTYMDFPPAYVMVDLYEDGTADSTFTPYSE